MARESEAATAARFWAKVDKGDPAGCWRWTASGVHGYGQFSVAGALILAHRYSWELLRAPIPAGLTLDHLCHTNSTDCPGGKSCPHRACVNPDHLEPVTMYENLRRAKVKELTPKQPGSLTAAVVQRVRDICHEREISGNELGRRAGVSQKKMTNVLSAAHRVTVADLGRIADALGMTASQLVADSGWAAGRRDS